MNCPKCGEVCCCSMEPPLPDQPAPAAAAAAESAQDLHTQVSPDEGAAWRDELSARLVRYRSRRKAPPPRYPSLRLPFHALDTGRSQIQLPEASLFPRYGSVSNHALAVDGTLEPSPLEAEPFPPTVEVEPQAASSRPTVSAKIIEFPRFAWAPPAPPPDQLAEPVGEGLRILEVPEVTPPPPALGGITIEPVQKEEVEKRLGIDVPLQSAPLGLRLLATLIDGLIVAAASALFGFIFWKVTAICPPKVQILGFAVAALYLFWSAYQYLLIVYAASTPGLRIARLELCRFDGSMTSRSLRRWRVLASYLSAASLGMGYAWVFLDEDVLCWHDRITRTYLAPRAREK